MANASTADRKLGVTWYCVFSDRNPDVRTARAIILNYTRVNGATAMNTTIFFDRLDGPQVANISINRWYNTDKIGFGQGVGSNHWIISEANKPKAFRKDVD